MTLQHEEEMVNQPRAVLRRKHYALQTEKTYLDWILRYTRFHHNRHPITIGEKHIETTLNHSALKINVTASTQNQALRACTVSEPLRQNMAKKLDPSLHL